MSRTLTDRNHNHPHYQLADHVQRMKEEYRKASNAELTKYVDIVFGKMSQTDASHLPPVPACRKDQIAFLLDWAGVKFKQEWRKKYGWPFEDIYVAGKLDQHQANHHAEVLGKTKEPLISRAELLVLMETTTMHPENKEAKQEYDHYLRISSVLRSGYAGVDKNGVILDRRHFAISAPLPKNEFLETPEPVEVTDDMRRQFAEARNQERWEAAKDFAPVDLQTIADKEGTVYSKEEFHKLPQDKQADIKAYRGSLLEKLCHSGYAGVTKDGKIVDRRLVEDATPLPKSAKFGNPEPRPLPSKPPLCPA